MPRLTVLVPLALMAVSLAACHDDDPHVCLEGVSCDTGNPCMVGAVMCGADDVAHCVVQRVEPSCPTPPPSVCVAGTTCDTGNPCHRGENVCGADGTAHCIVTVVEDVPGCP